MSKTDYKKYYEWIPLPVRVVGTGILAYAGYKAIRTEIDKAQANKRRRQLENTQVQYVYETPGGQINTASIDLGTIAAQIYDALHNTGLIWWDEDEAKATRALLQVPRSEIPALEDLYFRLYGYILKEDIIDTFNNEQQARVMHLFN